MVTTKLIVSALLLAACTVSSESNTNTPQSTESRLIAAEYYKNNADDGDIKNIDEQLNEKRYGYDPYKREYRMLNDPYKREYRMGSDPYKREYRMTANDVDGDIDEQLNEKRYYDPYKREYRMFNDPYKREYRMLNDPYKREYRMNSESDIDEQLNEQRYGYDPYKREYRMNSETTNDELRSDVTLRASVASAGQPCADGNNCASGLFCCSGRCQQPLYDWAGLKYCPSECRGGPLCGAGTCYGPNAESRNIYPRPAGIQCSSRCQCSSGCCEGGRCVDKKRDWANVPYCPAECRGGPFASVGTC